LGSQSPASIYVLSGVVLNLALDAFVKVDLCAAKAGWR